MIFVSCQAELRSCTSTYPTCTLLLLRGSHNNGASKWPSCIDWRWIHASCCSGTEVPILHPFTRHKNVAMYRTIFGRLKEVIGHVRGLRVVLESGKAAIRAAKEAFPKAHVEG
ncbi:hypothetical protein RB195_004873 [Necator americanus]|uniref:Uncharacterized protein n=1 Tax=Necator americanus TaxID=51031 RepID=A0ABR1BM20_NECAM